MKNLMAGGQPLPLLVSGVPGLELRAIPGKQAHVQASKGERASRTPTVDQRRARLEDGVGPWLIDTGWRASRLFGSAPQVFLGGLKENASPGGAGQAAMLTLLVVTVAAPGYGTESFDNLLAAAQQKENQSTST
ncbi:hypothetical protein [Arthrobacter ipis]|uniref:hypothetical protein n=1 Tax=Arthrobacter ipis TaxID=2716202 RepID=UPI001C4A3304|nr:hypothetical protein [Arthrobacter ipis]